MRRPERLPLLAALAFASCTSCSIVEGDGADAGATAPASTVLASNATVERVVDGDTVVVDIDGHRETVRLIGIDTPETVKPNSPVECFGPEASAATKALLPEGTPVRLERDVEGRDDYDRLLVYLYRSVDGMFVNLELVRSGYATLLTFPPNIAHVDDFVVAAEAARTDGLGLWSGCSSSGSG
jgi:micrococcal nuclease